MKRRLATALAVLAILAACCVCDTLDSRPEPGKFRPEATR